jgi:hypothetical protein
MRLARLLTVVVLLLMPRQASAAFALVNTTTATGPGSGTTLATLGTSATVGNSLIVAVSHLASQVQSIADSAGDTFAICGPLSSTNTFANFVEIWYASQTNGNASNVVTVTFAAATSGRAIHLLQYSGGPIACDKGATGNAAGSPPGTTTTSAFTPTAAGQSQRREWNRQQWRGGVDGGHWLHP